MWKRKMALPITLVAIALGFLISLQIQTHRNVSAAEQINEKRLSGMKTVLANAQARNQSLKDEDKALTDSLDKARQEGGTDPSVLVLLDRLKIMDGTQAVQGPGIQILIDDRKQEHKVVFPLTTDDLMRIINTLKFAGAEAISLNGQRIVDNTAIVFSGTSTILVNQVPINRVSGVPYEIDAIGDQDTLVDYISNLEAAPLKEHYGVNISIVRKVIEIPSFKGSYSNSYTKP